MSETRMVKFVKRPTAGKLGKRIMVNVNSYQITAFPTKNVIQYDVTIGDGTARRSLNKKVWCSAALRQRIGTDWEAVLFDGNKLAWSFKPLPFGAELNVQIDLAQEFGKKKPDVIRVVIKKTTIVALAPVEGWINGSYEADEKVQEGMTFLNHLISQSLRLDPTNVCLKRSFFRAGCETHRLEGGLVVKRGLFLSVRGGANKLFVNVDVATSVFWPQDNLLQVLKDFIGGRLGDGSIQTFASNLANQWQTPLVQAKLKHLRRIQIYTKHTKGKSDAQQKRFLIDGFTPANAQQTTFTRKVQKIDGSSTATTITVADYFKDVYGVKLQFPNLRLVRTKKAGNIPIELCYVDDGNRYTPKLDDRQTSAMIKITATRPNDRRSAITNLVNEAKWGQDSVLSKYGMKIHSLMHQVGARILPTPTIEYSGGNTVQSQAGQWDLKGRRFFRTGVLKSFGLLIFEKEFHLNRHDASAFLQALCNSYIGHGGRVENVSQAPIDYAAFGSPPKEEVLKFYKKVGNTFKQHPDVIFCVFGFKSSMPYNDIKAICDVDLGCLSQCLLTKHVKQKNPQYLSNVCMKVNAKLGGVTCTITKSDHPLFGKSSTLVIGADVSHAAPGIQKQSFASMVGSLDLQATRFGAVCDVNGIRTEMITDRNMDVFLKTMLRNFRSSTGVIPDRILYFRDGVSEQQYSHVILQEVAKIKEICATMPVPAQQGPYSPKLTVTICSKRHHHRFFPVRQQDGDRNGNVMPGTIIDSDICDPSEYDFYLNSHKAIQGTARATHYYVIYDENKFTVDEFQKLCYNMCFTYIRSTTSVSLVPAVYYAHLASQRARCHEPGSNTPTPTIDSGAPGKKPPSGGSGGSGGDESQEPGIKKLNHRLIATMWYV